VGGLEAGLELRFWAGRPPRRWAAQAAVWAAVPWAACVRMRAGWPPPAPPGWQGL